MTDAASGAGNDRSSDAAEAARADRNQAHDQLEGLGEALNDARARADRMAQAAETACTARAAQEFADEAKKAADKVEALAR